jgi:hypothetical protein
MLIGCVCALGMLFVGCGDDGTSSLGPSFDSAHSVAESIRSHGLGCKDFQNSPPPKPQEHVTVTTQGVCTVAGQTVQIAAYASEASRTRGATLMRLGCVAKPAASKGKFVMLAGPRWTATSTDPATLKRIAKKLGFSAQEFDC